jgi:signal transduction histidine kinase
VAELWVNTKDYQRWRSLIEREEIVHNFETQFRRYDGTIICVDNRAQALYAADGQTLYYEGCLEDITEHVQIEVALRRRNRELALINRASQAFNSTLNLDRVLITVLEEVRYLLDIVASSAWLIDPDSGELVCWHATGPRSEITRGWRLAPGEGIAGWVAQNGKSLIVPDVWLDQRHFKGVDQQTGLALRAILSVPLQVKGRVIGVLQVVDAEVDRFKPADLALIEPLAASAAIAIENARLYATEQQRAIALARALEKQRELDRLKNEFVQNVSHELRTPLAIIRGYAEMMVAGELGTVDAGWQDILTIVVRRARILNNLIEDITAILQNEALQAAQEPVSMVKLIRTSLADFQVLADQAGLTLRGEIAEPVPQISGDVAHLRKVVDNLVSNALKFTPSGGTITLKLHSTGEEVVFQVSDTGIGIAPEHHERIFDRFYQVNGSTRRRYGGTGLGLALVKEVVEAHGGTVSIESQPDQGTTFTVSLPRAKD